ESSKELDSHRCLHTVVVNVSGRLEYRGGGVDHGVGSGDVEIGRARRYASEMGVSYADLLLSGDGRSQDLITVPRVDRRCGPDFQAFHVARKQRQARQWIEKCADGRGDNSGAALLHTIVLFVMRYPQTTEQLQLGADRDGVVGINSDVGAGL